MSVKDFARQFARVFGLDIRKYDSLALEHTRTSLLLAEYNVDLVLDIGANTGQWAQTLRHSGYLGEIISFEPLAEEHIQLTKRARRDSRWTIAPKVVLGERIADVEINVAGNSVSSSLLPMLPMHLAGAPESAYVRSEKVQMKTLDSFIGSVIPDHFMKVFCKLDVQGYELKILNGAESLLKKTVGLQMEISLVPLYRGQSSFGELLDTMARLGFDVHGLIPGFVDPNSGRMLQIDGIFFRDNRKSEVQ